MKIRTSWVMAAALAAFPMAASAQIGLGIGGGPSTPLGDFGDVAEAGFHAQASLHVGVPLLPLGFRGDAMYQQFAAESSGTFRQAGGLANATLGLPVPLIVISPYAIGGVGAFRHMPPEVTVGGVTVEGEESTEAAWNVGAGLRLGLPGISASLEARYLDMGNGVKAVPVTVGIRF